MKILRNVKYEDLTPEQQGMVDSLGMDTFLKLVEQFGGMVFYVPKAETVGRSARNAMIQSEFTGYNYKQLALKYGLTEVQIRNIIKKQKNED